MFWSKLEHRKRKSGLAWKLDANFLVKQETTWEIILYIIRTREPRAGFWLKIFLPRSNWGTHPSSAFSILWTHRVDYVSAINTAAKGRCSFWLGQRPGQLAQCCDTAWEQLLRGDQPVPGRRRALETRELRARHAGCAPCVARLQSGVRGCS